MKKLEMFQFWVQTKKNFWFMDLFSYKAYEQ